MKYGYVLHDTCGVVRCNAPRTLLLAWLHVAKQFIDKCRIPQHLDKVLKYTYTLDSAVAKDVYMWLIPSFYRYLPRDVYILFTLRDLSLIYADFYGIDLDLRYPWRSSIRFLKSGNLNRAVRNFLMCSVGVRKRNRAGIYLACRHLCGYICSRDLEKLLTCQYSQYLHRVETCQRERENTYTIDYADLPHTECYMKCIKELLKLEIKSR